jgi:hypothetical protein
LTTVRHSEVKNGVEAKEVGGQQPGGLSAQESPSPSVGSAGRGPKPGGSQNPVDGAGAQPVSEPGQFTVDPAMAPGGILLCQAQNQLTDLLGDQWAA